MLTCTRLDVRYREEAGSGGMVEDKLRAVVDDLKVRELGVVYIPVGPCQWTDQLTTCLCGPALRSCAPHQTVSAV